MQSRLFSVPAAPNARRSRSDQPAPEAGVLPLVIAAQESSPPQSASSRPLLPRRPISQRENVDVARRRINVEKNGFRQGLFHIFRSPRFDATPPDCYYQIAGWSSLVARWAHNPKVASSNLAPATKNSHKTKQLRGAA